MIQTVTASIERMKPHSVYGTGGYQEQVLTEVKIDDSSPSFCVKDNNVWILSEGENTDIVVYIISGDEATIKDLVKKEIDHFDSDVVWK